METLFAMVSELVVVADVAVFVVVDCCNCCDGDYYFVVGNASLLSCWQWNLRSRY